MFLIAGIFMSGMKLLFKSTNAVVGNPGERRVGVTNSTTRSLKTTFVNFKVTEKMVQIGRCYNFSLSLFIDSTMTLLDQSFTPNP